MNDNDFIAVDDQRLLNRPSSTGCIQRSQLARKFSAQCRPKASNGRPYNGWACVDEKKYRMLRGAIKTLKAKHLENESALVKALNEFGVPYKGGGY